MEDNKNSSSSLSFIFSQAQKTFQELENSSEPTNSESFQTKVKHAIQTFHILSQRIENLQLFSKNEELEDISTLSLPYLFINYYMAELVLKLVNPQTRISNLQTAKVSQIFF